MIDLQYREFLRCCRNVYSPKVRLHLVLCHGLEIEWWAVRYAPERGGRYGVVWCGGRRFEGVWKPEISDCCAVKQRLESWQ